MRSQYAIHWLRYNLLILLSTLGMIYSEIFKNTTCPMTFECDDPCYMKIEEDGRLLGKCTIVKMVCIAVQNIPMKTLKIEIAAEMATKSKVDLIDPNVNNACATLKTAAVKVTEDRDYNCSMTIRVNIPEEIYFILSLFEELFFFLEFRAENALTAMKFNDTCFIEVRKRIGNNQGNIEEFEKCKITSQWQALEITPTGNQNIGDMITERIKNFFIEYDVIVREIDMPLVLKQGIYLGFLLQGIYKTGLQNRLLEFNWPNNGVELIPSEMFPKPFPSITNMNLSNNDIKETEPDLYSSFPKLRVLDLSNNIFSSIPAGLNWTQNLQELYIGSYKSRIFNLTKEALSSISQITLLSLSGSELLSSDLSSLKELTKLERLYLKNCKLQNLPDGFFHFLPSLREIDLSSNRLTDFIYETKYSSIIERLDLSSNLIEKFQIKLHPSSTNTSVSSIKRIDLANNAIQPWTEEVIPKQITVLNLNISQNKLHEINKHMITDFNQVQTLNMKDNLLDCSSCLISNTKSWLNETSIIIINDLFCTFPVELQGQSVSNVNPDLKHCVVRASNLMLIIGLSVGITIFILILIIVICYRFKYYVRKDLDLTGLKKKRETSSIY